MPKISSLIPILILVFAVSGFLFPHTAHAGSIFGDILDRINPLTWAQDALAAVAEIMLRTVGLLTGLAGVILNGIIYYTVGQMSVNYSNLTTINSAWSAIGDLANMGFIFILLYAAIQTILGIGSDAKKLIVNIIVVAILINFSLFFTKLIIDISNILAIMFYDAIAPGALNATATLSLEQAGLSNAFMQSLNLQSLYDVKVGMKDIITIGIMGSIMLLIAAFVFFAAALMFIIRYVILILVLILSPIAFMAFVLPALKSHGDRWKDALIGQAFFAPIYLMLTWVALHVLGGATGAGGITGAIKTSFGINSTNAALSGLALTNQGVAVSAGAFAMFINFIIVIVFLIASLVIAKEWANKAGGGVSKLTSWVTGAAGGATIGVAGRFGRGTLGRAGAAVGDSEKLKERATQGGVGGMAARLALATGRKTSGASFDIRGTGLGGTLDAGKAGGKGGFAEFRKKKAEDAEKVAKAMGPSQETLDQAEQAVKNTNAGTAEGDAARKKLDELKGVTPKEVISRKTDLDRKKDAALKEAPESKREKEMEEKIKEVEKKREEADRMSDEATVGTLNEELKKLEEEKKLISEIAKKEREKITSEFDARINTIKPITSAGDVRKLAYANKMENSYWARARGYNRAAAAQIRRGKSNEKKLAEAYKAVAKDVEPETEATETTTETSPTKPSASAPSTT